MDSRSLEHGIGRALWWAQGGVGVLALLLAAGPAQATLGQALDSVAVDRQTISPGGALTHQNAAGYSVSQFQTAAGTTVREYVAPNGIVFGVAWDGPQPPNLAVLLGQYFGQFQKNVRQQPLGLRRSLVQGNDLVVQTGGHMLALKGRAYVPSLIPAGVDAEVVQ
jgi:hypothetical protein